jgi:hypothetical protein
MGGMTQEDGWAREQGERRKEKGRTRVKQKGTPVTVTFLQWSLIGPTLTILFLGSALLVFRYTVPVQSNVLSRPESIAYIADQRQRLGPMPPAERWALGWFGLAILLWFLPDIARLVGPRSIADAVRGALHMSVPALLPGYPNCPMPAPRDRGAGPARRPAASALRAGDVPETAQRIWNRRRG